MPVSTRPSTILRGVAGLRPDAPSLLHTAEKIGASSTMNSGFSDWNQPAGTSKLPSMRSVLSFAYRFISPPACSNAAQNSTTNTNSMKITRSRSVSSAVSGACVPPDCASERCAAGTMPTSPR